MNWFKVSNKQPSIIVSSYNNFGDMSVIINGKRYKYIEVSPYNKDMLEQYIRYKNWSYAFKLIRSLKMEEKEDNQQEFNF